MKFSNFYILFKQNDYNDNFSLIFDSICEFLSDSVFRKYRNMINFYLFLFDKNREKLNLSFSYYENIPNLDIGFLKNIKTEIEIVSAQNKFILIKLHIKNRPYGFFVIELPNKYRLKEKTKEFLFIISYYLVHELYSIKIFNIVIKDGLTGLYNKRYLLSNLYQNFKKFKTENLPFCLAIIDIDKFKHYNDAYGHQIGDYLLKKVSKIILNFSPSYNLQVYRYGGEEIVISLPNKDKGESIYLMEKLRQKIQTFDFSNQDYFLKLTISLGIASIQQADSVSSLISKADSALYFSKENGRNRVTFYSDKLLEES